MGKIKEKNLKDNKAKTEQKTTNVEEVNLKELQIKLERIRAYIKKTESRVAGNESTLARLREKRMQVENKRVEMSVSKRHKLVKDI